MGNGEKGVLEGEGGIELYQFDFNLTVFHYCHIILGLL